VFDQAGVFVELHSAWEADRPREAEMERDLERHRRVVFELRNGSLEGYVPRRSFPCRGAIYRVAENDSHETLECDQCGWTTTIRRPRPRLADTGSF
jgi:hypothetical protein